ncbi:MAG: hypothetical protein RBR68_07160 [Tenuifilaceae bacterium]|nr:hypothetical protein [Tenuifilaceae bacterium]
MAWTDDPIVAGITRIKAVHINEIRDRLDSHTGVGGSTHPLATPTTAGFMSPAEKSAITALISGSSGILSLVGIGPVTIHTDEPYSLVTPGISVNLATPAASGLMSAADKTKLDSIITTTTEFVAPLTSANNKVSIREATVAQSGYMTAKDKAKLNSLSATFGSAMAKGSIVAWYGTPTGLFDATGKGVEGTVMEGWAIANGNNSTPNLVDKFIVGAGNTYDIGDTGGEATTILSGSQLPEHRHFVGVLDSNSDNNFRMEAAASTYFPSYTFNSLWLPGDNSYGADYKSFTTNTNYQLVTSKKLGDVTAGTGTSSTHNNLPPYVGLYWLMKLEEKTLIGVTPIGGDIIFDLQDNTALKTSDLYFGYTSSPGAGEPYYIKAIPYTLLGCEYIDTNVEIVMNAGGFINDNISSYSDIYFIPGLALNVFVQKEMTVRMFKSFSHVYPETFYYPYGNISYTNAVSNVKPGPDGIPDLRYGTYTPNDIEYQLYASHFSKRFYATDEESIGLYVAAQMNNYKNTRKLLANNTWFSKFTVEITGPKAALDQIALGRLERKKTYTILAVSVP